MNLDKKLLCMSFVANRSDAQTKFLFDLCDKDFDKLLELEAKIKANFIYACPNDKQAVEEILSKPFKK